MNYYEYAPPIFRWLFGNTDIKPWEMFPWFWSGWLVLSIVIILASGIQLFKKKNTMIYGTLLILGSLAVLITPFLDKYYLDYEWRKAFSQPGFYINKQVKADNYADVQSFYFSGIGGDIGKEQFLQFPSLRIDPKRYTSTEFKTKDRYCDDSEPGPYQFIEKGYITYDDNGGLGLGGGRDLVDPAKKLGEKGHSSYGVHYIEKREDGCYQGTRDHVQSRYYVMREKETRVGLGLARERTVIVDSETGEVLGYTNYLSTDRNILFKLTLGLLDNVLPHGNNPKVTSTSNAQLIEYRTESSRYEISERTLIRYVLIPTHYYENPEGGVL